MLFPTCPLNTTELKSKFGTISHLRVRINNKKLKITLIIIILNYLQPAENLKKAGQFEQGERHNNAVRPSLYHLTLRFRMGSVHPGGIFICIFYLIPIILYAIRMIRSFCQKRQLILLRIDVNLVKSTGGVVVYDL